MFWVLSIVALALLLFSEGRYGKSSRSVAPETRLKEPPIERPKNFPVVEVDDITPIGQAITSAQAVKVFKIYMKTTGFLDKQELPDHVRYFSEDMKRHGEDLADRVNEEKRKFREYGELIGASEIRVLKRKLSKTNDEEKRHAIESEIAEYQTDIDEEEKYLRKALSDLHAFRSDKRRFVIDYINNLTQR